MKGGSCGWISCVARAQSRFAPATFATPHLLTTVTWPLQRCPSRLFICLRGWARRRSLSGYLVWLMGVAAYIAGRGLSCRKRPLAGIATFVLFAASIAYTKSGGAQAAIGIPGITSSEADFRCSVS